MKARHPAIVLSSTLLLLSAVPSIGDVEAGTSVQRCQAADGTTLYTDKPCAQLGANALPVAADLRNRIARSEAREQRTRMANGDAPDAATTLATLSAIDARTDQSIPTRRPVSAGCATSPQQLSQDLHASLAMGDVNRVAESYAWMGLDNRQGQQILDRLQGLTRQAVLNVQYYDAPIASASGVAMQYDEANGQWIETAAAPRPTYSGDGSMQLTLANAQGGQHSLDFKVRSYNGCWFVQY